MIKLLPFTEEDFDKFKSWSNSKEELFQFAGPIFTYPLTDDQLMNYLQMEDKKPLKVVLESTNETIGHCELNFTNGNKRLSRILVGKKDLRGKKVGEQIVRKMVDMLFQDPEIDEVDLNTFSWNKGAIRCYEKVGFKIVPENSEEMNVNGNDWTKINMTYSRKEYMENKMMEMKRITKYLFTSERLGFRNWEQEDFNDLYGLCSDEKVMEHFPSILSKEETQNFLDRLIAHYNKRGYNYFAVELLETGEVIGFTGLAYQNWESDFTPAIDIGWRLKTSAWGNGYATEGAKACLDFAKNVLGLNELIATCVLQNKPSENVMKKIGMTLFKEFNHPALKDVPDIERCVCYKIDLS